MTKNEFDKIIHAVDNNPNSTIGDFTHWYKEHPEHQKEAYEFISTELSNDGTSMLWEYQPIAEFNPEHWQK